MESSKPTILGNKTGVILFSILGSNCNLITLEGFFGIDLHFIHASATHKKFPVLYRLGARLGYFGLTFTLFVFFVFFQKSKCPPVGPQLLGSFAKRPHASSAPSQVSGFSSKENFQGGENSDGWQQTVEKGRFDTRPWRQQGITCFVWIKLVSPDRQRLPIWKYLPKK